MTHGNPTLNKMTSKFMPANFKYWSIAERSFVPYIQGNRVFRERFVEAIYDGEYREGTDGSRVTVKELKKKVYITYTAM